MFLEPPRGLGVALGHTLGRQAGQAYYYVTIAVISCQALS